MKGPSSRSPAPRRFSGRASGLPFGRATITPTLAGDSDLNIDQGSGRGSAGMAGFDEVMILFRSVGGRMSEHIANYGCRKMVLRAPRDCSCGSAISPSLAKRLRLSTAALLAALPRLSSTATEPAVTGQFKGYCSCHRNCSIWSRIGSCRNDGRKGCQALLAKGGRNFG